MSTVTGDAKESRRRAPRKKEKRHTVTRVTQCLYPECAHALVLDARLSLVLRKVDDASLYVL